MARILAISILLLVVYSWEDLKWILRRLAFSIFKGRNDPGKRTRALKLDERVGILVLLATVPIGLFYFISQADNLFAKLAWIGGILVALAIVAILSEILLRRTQVTTPLVGIVSLFSPMFATVAETAYLPRKVLAKFALLLSLPVFGGLLIHRVSSLAPESLVLRLDLLTIVLVGSLLLRLTVELLEYYFHLYNLEKLFSYYRVALGIALAIILLEG